MSYCIYLRKSRADLEAEARGEGETLARHEKALIELGKRQNLNITKIYREIVSGETIASRPIMQQVLTEVEQSLWDGVLVMEVERLARGDTIDQGIVAQTFKLSDTKIITPVKTYDPNNEYDEEYFEFGLFMSRREYKTINRRLQRGRIASVKEGKYVGNIPPYGYYRIKLKNDKGFTLKPNSEQAPIVKMIFNLYAYGETSQDGLNKEMGVQKIVRKLNQLKIPSAHNSFWVSATLQGMLRNPVYIGKIRWCSRPSKKKMVDGQIITERPRTKESEWIIADGLHEPLVDMKTWNTVQAKLRKNPSPPCPKHRQIKNPLAGLVVCGMCGRKMVRRPYTNKNYPDTLMCYATSCNNISSQLQYVEDRVLLSLKQWLNNYKLELKKKENRSTHTEIYEKALTNTQRELKTLEEQRNNIYDLLEKGVYSTNIFIERSQNINSKIEDCQKSIIKIKEESENKKIEEINKKTIIPRAEYVLESYPKSKTPAEKNELLKSVIEKVVYTKTVGGRWHNPDNFELVLYPKISHVTDEL